MTDESINDYQVAENSFCWYFLCTTDEDRIKIQKFVDKLLASSLGYSFYPEVDWGQYGYRPPERYQVWGAWRHPETKLFCFLLDEHVTKVQQSTSFMLYAAGDPTAVPPISDGINDIKDKLDREEKKAEIKSSVDEQLNRFRKRRPTTIVTTTLTVFTAIVNGFSLYLRKIPTPEFESDLLKKVYQSMVGLVHFAALGLLFMLIGFCMVIIVKYLNIFRK